LLDLRAAALGTAFGASRITVACAAAELLDGHACLGLTKEPNDLFLAETALFHIRRSPDG